MTETNPDDETAPDTRSFDLATRRIDAMLGKIPKGTCPCCIARALLWRGAALLEEDSGTAEAVGTIEEIAADIRERIEIPPDGTMH
jgi:hypothetical protein